MFSHVLQHENLRSVQSSVLFQLCKSHGIGFDVKVKKINIPGSVL